MAKTSERNPGTVCHVPLSFIASHHTPDGEGPASPSEPSVERGPTLITLALFPSLTHGDLCYGSTVTHPD